MTCLFVLVAIAFPRIALVLLYFFTTYLEHAYRSMVIVALGFVFLPLTTMTYAWIVNNRYPLDGIYLLVIVVSALADLGLLGRGEYYRRRTV
ncbi:MAG: hypothetical protein HY820_12580 [Acidobacteria bacterium]|nr:hypothetical protein [Acidobacteriota bacterium]